MKNTIYRISDLIDFFKSNDNYAATEFFCSRESEGIHSITRSALDNIFDEGYVRVITSKVVGVINLSV